MEIKVNTGLVTYNLGGKVEVEFNPTDIAFGDRIYRAIDALCAIQERAYPEETRDFLAFMMENDEEARDIIDGLFDKEVCRPLFGLVSVFALADGLPLWANLLMAILQQMKEGSDKRIKEVEKKIAKYTKDYD